MGDIKTTDVVWKKNKTCSYDDEGNQIINEDNFVVIGTLNDIEIGHYCNGHEGDEIYCIFKVDEPDGSGVFINRTIILNAFNNNDEYFRQAICNAYNNYHKIKSIFD